jgi:Protein of unknown function (DUF2283)
MDKFDFGVSISTDEATGALLAVYFRFRKGRVAKTKEFEKGSVFADYGSQGQLLGIELLGPCEMAVLERIARKEPKAKRFVRRSIPREMALT